MKKLLIGGASIAALAAGSVAVATLSPIQLASARDGAPAIEMQAGQAPSTTQPGQQGRQGGPRGPKRGPGGLDKALDDLVKDGTLSQEQADKVKAKLRSGMGHGGREGRPDFMGAGLAEIAKSIGITEDQLKSELKSGKSIAEVAQAHGVEPQKVINDLVAAATKKIDEAVASGKLPADRAAKLKEQLSDRITKMVNSKHGGKPSTGDKQRPGQPGQDDGSAPNGGDGSTTTAPPTTAAPSTTAAPTTAAPTTAAPATEAPRNPAGGDNTGTTR